MSDFGLRSDGFDLDDLYGDDAHGGTDLHGGADPYGGQGGVQGVEAGFGTAETAPGDGLVTAGYDSDGDGTADVLLADENGDGVTDVAMWDTNEDGVIDKVAYDEDYDGKIDLIYHDDNFDGVVDRVETAGGDLPGYTTN